MKKVIISLAIIIGMSYGVIHALDIYLTAKAQELSSVVDAFYDAYEPAIELSDEITPVPTFTTQDVVFTSYWAGDSTGSGAGTGSGFNADDFEINENGWYTWDGFVVVATATYECSQSTYGACAQYTSVPDGYHMMSYGDIMIINVNGIEYDAIVLDSCGASYWDEEYQRVDIFVSDEVYGVGKVLGSVTYFER